MNAVKIGQKVYVPQLEIFGTVEEVREDGRIVKIKTGDRIITVIDFIVENYSIIKFFIVSLLKLFK